MLVKDDTVSVDGELSSLKRELYNTLKTQNESRSDLNHKTRKLHDVKDSVDRASRYFLDENEKTELLKEKLATEKKTKKDLEYELKKITVSDSDDVVEQLLIKEEDYLIGLRVEGRKIVILLDRSASMTDDILIDVIRRKSDSDNQKQLGPKWIRAKKIVRWLLARLPSDSEFVLVGFNNEANEVGARGWSLAKDEDAINSSLKELEKIVPTGATNLQEGLSKLSRLEPTNIYLITDGLPTEGSSNYYLLNLFNGCSSLIGKSKVITGECRVKLFRDSISKVNLGSSIVNVILLN